MARREKTWRSVMIKSWKVDESPLPNTMMIHDQSAIRQKLFSFATFRWEPTTLNSNDSSFRWWEDHSPPSYHFIRFLPTCLFGGFLSSSSSSAVTPFWWLGKMIISSRKLIHQALLDSFIFGGSQWFSSAFLIFKWLHFHVDTRSFSILIERRHRPVVCSLLQVVTHTHSTHSHNH